MDMSSAADGREARKKRKVRKGTQSCWECKRRKSKCSFSSSGPSSACDSCVRRGTRCIGQQYPEDPASTRQQLGDRLGRVERLLASRRGSDPEFDINQSLPDQPNGQDKPTGLHRTSRNTVLDLVKPFSRSASDACVLFVASETSEDLNKALLKAWPSHGDLELLIGDLKASPGMFHGVICLPYSEFMCEPLPSPRNLLRLPPPNAHPVLVAQRLLSLGSFLQSLAPRAAADISGRLSTSPKHIMSRVVETAIRLVTSNDELVGSVEGIECLMMESMYHNNAGNLRRAYLSMRRALTFAQMLGLDRAANTQSYPDLTFLDPETSRRISPQHMWFRIVQSDGYLSLMLGLPQGSLDESFASPKMLDDCAPMERMERLLTLAGAQIIRKTPSCPSKADLLTTLKIDRMLLDSASLMPPKWWLTPDSPDYGDDGVEALDTILRVMNQLTYYHLLQRLHLPYILLSPSDKTYEYSRNTAIAASRELLSGFLSFRRSWPISGCYCRGVDFLAFISSMILCLGHIKADIHERNANSAFVSPMGHHRLQDRGMMENLLEIMGQVESGEPTDKIAPRVAKILGQLLAIEGQVAIGREYQADLDFTSDSPRDIGYNASLDDDGATLRIFIPHLGTIRIGCHDNLLRDNSQACTANRDERIATSPGVTQVAPGIGAENMAQPARVGGIARSVNEEDTSPDAPCAFYGIDSEDWDLQGVDLAFFESLLPSLGGQA